MTKKDYRNLIEYLRNEIKAYESENDFLNRTLGTAEREIMRKETIINYLETKQTEYISDLNKD